MTESSSIFAVDFGSVHTRAILFDVVAGTYRMVARAEVRSTGGFPEGDITIGLKRVAEQLANVSGRKLLDDKGMIITPEDINRSGVDIFIATASGGRSLRAILVGLMPGVSIESGIRATEGTYVNVVETLSLFDKRDEETQLNTIVSTYPDLIMITGGTERGATNPLKKALAMVKTALIVTPSENRPTLLYAGNSALAETVREEFGPLTKVLIADNVRPTLDIEDVDSAQLQLGRAFDEYKESQGSGFDIVSSMSAMGLLPSAQSYGVMAEYLGKAREDINNLILVDIGSSTGTFASYHNGKSHTSIRTDIGLGHSAPALVNSIPFDDIRRWIPFSWARADVMNYALNKSVRPLSIPITRKDLYLEHALVRAGIENMLKNQHPDWAAGKADVDLIVGAGSSITGTGNPGISAMLLTDGIQPLGVTDLYIDDAGIIAAMGALAYVAPEVVVQVMAGHNLERLATVFALDGEPNLRRKAASLVIEFDDGEQLEEELDGGEFIVIPLPPGKKAIVRLKVLRGNNSQIAGKRSITREVAGSLAGIIIDTRGRPIPLGTELQRRMLQMMLWYSRASGVYHQELEDSDLQPVEERVIAEKVPVSQAEAEAIMQSEEKQEQKRQRRGLFGRGGKRDKKSKEKDATPSVDSLIGDANNAGATEIDLGELDELLKDDGELDDLRL